VKTLSKFGRLLVLALCCMLVIFMTLELAHVHTAGSPDAAHCPLCIAAHTPVQTAITISATLTFALLGLVSVGDASPGIRLVRSVPRIRPPPIISSLSAVDALSL
jgi:hypothetical protein